MANFSVGGSKQFATTTLDGSHPGGVALSQAVGPYTTQMPTPTARSLSSAFPMANTISLGQYVLPGKWTLHKAERVFGWQIKVGHGLTGATIVPSGDPLMEIQFRGEFWAQADYFKFRQMRSLFLTQGALTLPGTMIQLTTSGMVANNANTGGTFQVTFAAGIVHPELNEMGVSAVVNHKIGPAIDRGAGLWEVRADFLEFRPPFPVQKQPQQKIKAAPPTAPLPSSHNSPEIAAVMAAVEEEKAKAKMLESMAP